VLLRAPWHGLAFPAALWGLTGLGGLIYVLIVTRRMRNQKAYQPDLEDWTFHIAAPLAVYAILGASACAASSYEREALFCVGACTLALLLIGIRNAWDSVAWLVERAAAAANAEADKGPQKDQG
jgi:hypothetical protein